MPVPVKGIFIPNFLFHEIPDLVLLGVQLDYQLFINRHGYFVPIRHSLHCPLKIAFIQFQPTGHTTTRNAFKVFYDKCVLTTLFLQANNITRLYLIGRNIYLFAVNLKMIMANKLTCLISGASKAQTIDKTPSPAEYIIAGIETLRTKRCCAAASPLRRLRDVNMPIFLFHPR